MIDQHLSKHVNEIKERYDNLLKIISNNPIDYYIILQNALTIYELSDKSLFSEDEITLFERLKKIKQENINFININDLRFNSGTILSKLITLYIENHPNE